jgi:hypothetical protein
VIGRWISDLDVGDDLPPVRYELTPFMVREYCHAVEDSDERYHGAGGEAIAPPTFVHVDKIRLLEHACPESGGPARMHYDFDAEFVAPLPVGASVVVTADIVERVVVRGRERLIVAFEVRDAETGVLYTRYRDTTLLSTSAES